MSNPFGQEEIGARLHLGGSDPRFADDYVEYAGGSFKINKGREVPEFLLPVLGVGLPRMAKEAVGWLEDQGLRLDQRVHWEELREYVSHDDRSSIAWGTVRFVALMKGLVTEDQESTARLAQLFPAAWPTRSVDRVADAAITLVGHSVVRHAPLALLLSERYSIPVADVKLALVVRSVSVGSIKIDVVNFLVGVGVVAAVVSAIADLRPAGEAIHQGVEQTQGVVDDLFTTMNSYLSTSCSTLSENVEMKLDLTLGPSKEDFAKTMLPLLQQRQYKSDPPTGQRFN